MGKIFCLMGKSSSGKDTLFKMLTGRNKRLKTIVPYTTRPIREGEKNGVEYFFVDAQKFQELQEKNQVIEYRTYETRCGLWTYFTADDGQIDLKTNTYIVIGTLASYLALRAYFGEGQVVPIYIETDDGIRLERALRRERMEKTPKYAEMCRRFLADEEDFSEDNLKRAGITVRFDNSLLQECLSCIENYIRMNSEPQ